MMKPILAFAAALMLAAPSMAQQDQNQSSQDFEQAQQALEQAQQALDEAQQDPEHSQQAIDQAQQDLQQAQQALDQLNQDQYQEQDEPQQEAGAIMGQQPRTQASAFRLTPVFGASSMTTTGDVNLDNLDQGFSAGVFADFGGGSFDFQTGVLALQADAQIGDDTAAASINNWGIPLVAKWNLSGKPHSTVYLKAGAMPMFTTGGDVDELDVLGIAGIGAALPLGRNSSFVIDAAYNGLVTTEGTLTDYEGITLLGGLSFNL
jgi:exonuclease VII small subunit